MFVQGCTQPPLVTHTCSSWHMWQAGRGAQHSGRGNRGRETAAHMMCRVAHIHVGTLPRHTQKGQKEGESGIHEEEAHAIRARKTEVNRKKTEMDSHLEVLEPDSQRDKKDGLSKK